MFEDISSTLRKLLEEQQLSAIQELEKIYSEIQRMCILYIENTELRQTNRFSEISKIFSRLSGIIIKSNTTDINQFTKYLNNTKDVLVDIRKELHTLIGFTGK